ncbi:MAG TPA: DedA family protein [Coriobacteriia bacterium]
MTGRYPNLPRRRARATLARMGHLLAQLLEKYGVFAVFLLVMLEDFGMPTPGETALIAASVAAAAGKLNIWAVIVAALAGAIVGDNVGYAIGHFGGRRLVTRVGGRFGFGEERFAYAEAFFRRHGDVVVVGARFVEVLRQLNGIIAGTMGMHWATFLAFNSLGAALWVGVWSAVGYFAGENRTLIEAWFLRFSWLALIALAVAIVAWVLTRRRRASAE